MTSEQQRIITRNMKYRAERYAKDIDTCLDRALRSSVHSTMYVECIERAIDLSEKMTIMLDQRMCIQSAPQRNRLAPHQSCGA